MTKENLQKGVETTRYVAPIEEDILGFNSTVQELLSNVSLLEQTILELMEEDEENTTLLNSQLSKLKQAEELLNQSIDFARKNDYLSAFIKLEEAQKILDEVNSAVTQEAAKIETEKNKKRKYAVYITLILIIVVVLYYLWTPPKEEVKLTSSYHGSKKRHHDIISEIKKHIEKIKKALSKLSKSEERTRPRYNYHRRKRWSS